MKRLTALLLVLSAGACSRTPAPGLGELRVVPLGGDVTVVDGDERSLLDEATTVDSGVRVLTGSSGRARIQLPSGSSVELAPSADLQLDGQVPEIGDGSSVLVRTNDSDITVRAGGAEIEASDAVFRLENGLSVILAVYAGEATVLGSGVDPVPALRQANVISGDKISRGFQPLQVRPNDPWDAAILGEAIELGRRLGYLERGLTHQLPRGHEAQAVSSVLENDFGRRAIESAITSLGNAARAVVAAVVAQEAVRIDGGSLSQILQEVVNLQVLGANWIVIVAQWGLAGAASVLTQHVGALASAIAESVAPPPAPPTTSSASPGPSQTSPANNPSPKGDASGNPGKGGSAKPPPPPPPDGEGDQAQSPSCSGTVDCAVGDILDGPGSP